MTYRDDREALHNQVTALEEDLAEARRDAANRDEGAIRDKAAALEAQMATMRAELGRMETELAELRGPTPPAKKPSGEIGMRAAFLIVGALSAICVVIGIVVKERSLPRSSFAPVVVPPRDEHVDRAQLLEAVKQPPPPQPASATPAASVVPDDPPRVTEARWLAHVKHAEGLPLGAGSSCTVDATIQAQPVNAIVKGLVVTCNGKPIYSSTDALNGMAMGGNDARERLGPKDDKSRFTLQYTDKGTRTGDRSQIDLDSNKGMALVFSENLPPFRIELTIPLESELAQPLSGKGQRLSRRGTVSEVGGAAPVKAGERCTVRAISTGQQQSCVAEVRCGAKTLVPMTAPVKCGYDHARIRSVHAVGAAKLDISEDDVDVTVDGISNVKIKLSAD